MLQDDVIEVMIKDENAFFLLSAFREETWVDENAQDIKWSNTEIYKLLKKECPVCISSTCLTPAKLTLVGCI